MKEIMKEIFSSLFNSNSENSLEFVTWTGEDGSFIVKKDDKEYRIRVTEEVVDMFSLI